ncbi:MAG: lipid II flippase MurJ, partial [Pseudomonadota bacterium]
WMLARGAGQLGHAAELDARFRSRIGRISVAALGMGMVIWVLALVLSDALVTPSVRYGALALLVGAGILSYFGLGQLLGAFKLSEFRSALRRG